MENNFKKLSEHEYRTPPDKILREVKSNMEVTRFTANVLDTYIGRIGSLFADFMKTVFGSDKKDK